MLKLLGKILITFAVSSCSPAWFLLNEALKGYFNLSRAAQGPMQMLAEYDHFNRLVLQYPNEVLYVLFPKLILTMLLSFLFVICMSRFCFKLAEHVSQFIAQKSLFS